MGSEFQCWNAYKTVMKDRNFWNSSRRRAIYAYTCSTAIQFCKMHQWNVKYGRSVQMELALSSKCIFLSFYCFPLHSMSCSFRSLDMFSISISYFLVFLRQVHILRLSNLLCGHSASLLPSCRLCIWIPYLSFLSLTYPLCFILFVNFICWMGLLYCFFIPHSSYFHGFSTLSVSFSSSQI